MIVQANVNDAPDEEVGLVPEPRSQVFHNKYGSIPAWSDSFLDPNKKCNLVTASNKESSVKSSSDLRPSHLVKNKSPASSSITEVVRKSFRYVSF
mmetsp:Transcript_16941/g.23548  ORF Transcript_16941/g.23548 Transcript_16941/m.23548 type:complete len:95 (+) Transcript_16941:219-503(+)